MDYVVLDSSGTDDDVPPTYQTGGPRVLFSGNGRSLAGAHSQPRPRNKLDSDIHQIEQQAYAGVLRAFKMQSDDITWEKESLITELRRELEVSDEEHRVLLNKVNEEESIDRIRKLRQGGSVVHNHVPFKRQKEIHYPHSLPVGHQSPFTPLNVLAGNKAYTMAPEDTRWSSANQALPNRGAWQAADGVMLSTGKKGERFHMNEDYALPNGFGAMDFGHVGIPDTGNIVKEVERILSHPVMHEIIKAKRLLRDHEQALLDAIARLDEPSDGESVGEDAKPLPAGKDGVKNDEF